ncbi:type II secretion system protein [Brevibacillus fluminis]|nr:prepilin-type N-terminal cleavage/methylation domain-containing protein [Brevibacillus fluminis]
MKRARSFRDRFQDDSGLTLIELLAGLVLFGLVITMVNGVFFSALSLKKEVTADVTIRNHADALTNAIITSMTNTDKSDDVLAFINSKPGDTVGGVMNTTANSTNDLYQSALWTSKKQLENTTSPRIYYLYTIVPVKKGSNGPPYKLIRETFSVPTNRSNLLFTETCYFTSYAEGTEDWRAPSETVQLNDPAFPLLAPSSVTVETNETGDSALVLNLTMGQTGNDAVHYQITSRIHID